MRPRVATDPETDSVNRTMRRGLAILRAFRPGLSALTNGDLAERCGLPRSTVSRLTGALLESGLLRQLPGSGGYAPTAVCVSLGSAALQALGLRHRVLARMEQVADAEGVSVSLAIPDGDEMIFVDTFRRARKDVLLHVEPGSRLPMESSALGLAALAAMQREERAAAIDRLLGKHKGAVTKVRAGIRDALRHAEQHGWCGASWVSGRLAVARAVQPPGYPVFSFNCAGSVAQMSQGKIEKRLVPALFELTELVMRPDANSKRHARSRSL